MGSPDWGNDPRFATKPDRVANWDALHALMSAWSRQHDKQWIAEAAQAAHVPSFPLREPAEQLASPQLEHRGFWRPIEIGGRAVKAPGPPFGLRLGASARGWIEHERRGPCRSPASACSISAGSSPARRRRAIWPRWGRKSSRSRRRAAAIRAAHPSCTRSSARRKSRSSSTSRTREAVEIARALAGKSDVLIENFATGVMDRLGLGADALKAVNPDLVYVSASGLGRTGPEAHAVAYGTLLQCYAGFAGLNRHPEIPPRVGFAWLDPMCGLMLAFGVAAALWQRRRTGAVARIDFSMIEAMLWTMAEPLLATQLGPPPTAGRQPSGRYFPHDVYRCLGEDDWVGDRRARTTRNGEGCARSSRPVGHDRSWGLASAQRRRAAIDGALAAWAGARASEDAADELLRAGIPAAALASSVDLVNSRHLSERGFWEPQVPACCRVCRGAPASAETRAGCATRRRHRDRPRARCSVLRRRDRCPAPIGSARAVRLASARLCVLTIGWIGAVRPSRQPLRGFLRMRFSQCHRGDTSC